MTDPRVLNWGCGHQWSLCPPSWVCSDVLDYAQHHVGSVLHGLPYPTDHFDAVVHHHALQALDWHGVRPALAELARVTRPEGWMRFTVPDLAAGIEARARGDRDWFPVNRYDEPTVDGAFCAWATWFGTNRTVFTIPWIHDVLVDTGWVPLSINGVVGCGATLSPWPEITVADDRCAESILVEARLP